MAFFILLRFTTMKYNWFVLILYYNLKISIMYKEAIELISGLYESFPQLKAIQIGKENEITVFTDDDMQTFTDAVEMLGYLEDLPKATN